MELNLVQIARAVAAAVPDRVYFVHGDTRLTYREFLARCEQLANALHVRGLGCARERSALEPHESGQDHLAVYLHNGQEHLEALVGSYAARVAPFNVNYRYVDEEIVALLTEQRAVAVVFHSAFAPLLGRIRLRLPLLHVLLQVRDGSDHPLLAGAEWYEEALSEQPASPPPVDPSPDDLYILCTGGTTGSPKGVLWRQADVFVAALSGTSTRLGREYSSMSELVGEAVERGTKFRNMPTAPFMHGAAQWQALTALTHGNAVVLPDVVQRLDARDVWTTAARERVTMMQIVGDAFARPLLDELEATPYDLSALRVIMNGGAMLSDDAKRRLIAGLPGVTIGDGLGTSESGAIASATFSETSGGAVFDLREGSVVLSADLSRRLQPGEDELGWLGTSGRIPLGYLGDREKTAATFPMVGAQRFVVPGDRARLRADGRAELLGRDSVTINSGGEKIFAEEVEQALLSHPDVVDVVVCGRPSARWGSEVVAVVSLRTGSSASADELCAAAARQLARYKLPKQIIFRGRIERSPAGKADYRWAQAQVAQPESG